MKKLTKTQFLIVAFIVAVAMAIAWSFTWDMNFPGDLIYKDHWGDINKTFGAVHIVYNVISIIGWMVLVGFLINEASDEDADKFQWFYREKYGRYDDDKESKPIKIRKPLFWLIGLVLLIFLFIFGKNVVNGTIRLYNTSQKYQNEYVKRVQEKQGFYDKLWKTYLQKEKITNINKETFVEVTKIIMENRKDGEQVTWKWLQENQQIPYEEFTKFYADLSSFIAKQREDYFKIEQICQEIANRNNTMLDTFPNNIYNRYLKCERINFEYGFLSDSTTTVFTSKKENIK